MFTRKLNPDLIVVSGTQLIKQPMLDIPVKIGIVNLHTGLSPYVKGGPNCTNWCIANNEWHLVGNTIMWINAGIDSGNIITTETIDIRNANTLLEAHKLVMEHAHDLYIRAIDYLITHQPPHQSIPQNSLAKGKLFLTKMWTAEKRKLLLENWKKRGKVEFQSPPVCVSLPVESKV
jgi:methionyl-tRNA formyltransferase